MEIQEYRKIVATLPASLRNAYYSDETYSQIKDAANLAKLNQNKLNILTTIVTNILLGITSLSKFNEELKERMGIPDANLDIINKVIQEKLFEPLKNELNQLEVNKPKFTFPTIQQKETTTPQKPIETQKLNVPEIKIPAKTISLSKTPEVLTKQEVVAPKKTEELIPKTSLSEEKPKAEINNPSTSIPDITLPEVSEIKIERPVNKTGELKRVAVPSVSPETQQKIHSKLMEAIKKKDSKPSIVEAIKKVVNEGIKQPMEKKTPTKNISQEDEISFSQITAGENNHFTTPETTKKTSEPKPYILDVKIKEEKEKKENLPKGEIKYQRPEEKPFGEA